MLQDSPISRRDDDDFKRDRFVNAVIEEIKNVDTSQCFVIGMYGKWGTGKTSLINLFQEELKTKYYFTAYFNPWRFRDEEKLLKELFSKIIKGTNNENNFKDKSAKLGKLLKKYSEYISFPKLSFLGAGLDISDTTKNAVKLTGETLDQNESIEDIRNDINEILNHLATPLIIFIDDIDRLDNAEIQQIFKILKLTADFNNLIYVLAFDEDMVAKSLSQVYGNSKDDGIKFIEKIIQLPLRIPAVNKKQRFQYTIDLLNDWIDKKNIDKYLNKENLNIFLQVYESLHNLVVETPRDSKRLVNSISFVESCLREEISIPDLIMIETIRIFMPSIFKLIIEENTILFSKPTTENRKNITIERNSDSYVKEYKERLFENGLKREVARDIITYLFPYNDLFDRNYFLSNDESKVNFNNQRIGVYQYFSRYLEFKLGEDQIPDSKFKQILLKFNEAEEYQNIVEEIKILLNYSNYNIMKMIALNVENLNANGKINFIKLLTTEKYFHKKNNIDDLVFQKDIRLPLEILCKVKSKENVIDLLKYMVENNANIYYVIDFLFRCKVGFKLSDQTVHYKIPYEKEIDEIEKEFVEKISLIEVSELFENEGENNNMRIFSHLEDAGKFLELRKNIHEYVEQSDVNLFNFLKSLVSPSYEGFSFKKSYSRIDDSTFKYIEKYLEREWLKKRIKKIYPQFQINLLKKEVYELNLSNEEQIAFLYLKFLDSFDEENTQ